MTSIRIPRSVNIVLDVLGRAPAVTASVSAVVLLLATYLWHPRLAIAALAVAAAWAGGMAASRRQLQTLRTEVASLQVDNGRLTEELRHVSRGDATAVTAKLFTLPTDHTP